MKRLTILTVLCLMLLSSFATAAPLPPNPYQCTDGVLVSMNVPGLGELGKNYIYEDGWVEDLNDYQPNYGKAPTYNGKEDFNFQLTGDLDTVTWTSDKPIDKVMYSELNGAVEILQYTGDGGFSGTYNKKHDAIVQVFACVTREHYRNGWTPEEFTTEVPEFGFVELGLASLFGTLLLVSVHKKRVK